MFSTNEIASMTFVVMFAALGLGAVIFGMRYARQRSYTGTKLAVQLSTWTLAFGVATVLLMTNAS